MQESQEPHVDNAAAPVASKPARSWLLPGVIAFIAIALLLYFIGRDDTEAPATPAPPPITQIPDALEAKPELALGQQTASESDQPVVEVPPVPTASPLTASNDTLAKDLRALSDSSNWHNWTDTEDLVRRFSVVLDNLSVGALALNPLPVQAPKQPFKAQQRSTGIFLDPGNYARYQPYVDVIKDLDADQLAMLYRKYLPLLEHAYSELEDTDTDVDRRITDSLEVLLATPAVAGPIQLREKGGIYVFSDPALEALPAVQKQIIRMGPENSRIVLDKLAQLKQALEN